MSPDGSESEVRCRTHVRNKQNSRNAQLGAVMKKRREDEDVTNTSVNDGRAEKTLKHRHHHLYHHRHHHHHHHQSRKTHHGSGKDPRNIRYHEPMQTKEARGTQLYPFSCIRYAEWGPGNIPESRACSVRNLRPKRSLHILYVSNKKSSLYKDKLLPLWRQSGSLYYYV